MPSSWEQAWYWGALLAACRIVVCFRPLVPVRYSKFFWLWTWCLINSWALATGKLFWASGSLHPDLDALGRVGWQAFSLTLVLPAAVLLIPDKIFKHWRWGVTALALCEMTRMSFQGYGWLNSSSFSGAMLTCTLPVLPWWAQVPVGLAVLRSGSVTVWLVLGGLGAALLYYQGWWRAYVAYCAAAVAAFWFAGPWIAPHTGARLAGWRATAEWLAVKAPPGAWLAGTGLGSFEVLGPRFGLHEREIWLQLHSDWFQILLELGGIGFVLSLAAFAWISVVGFRSRHGDALASVWGLAACATSYYPLRSFWGMLFLLVLVREIVENEPRAGDAKGEI